MELNQHHRSEFPNLLKLAALGLTAPIHTSDCEWGFSAQNNVKTALRNRLAPERLDDLIAIKIEGETMDTFDFNGALSHWRFVKQRKMFLSQSDDKSK